MTPHTWVVSLLLHSEHTVNYNQRGQSVRPVSVGTRVQPVAIANASMRVPLGNHTSCGRVFFTNGSLLGVLASYFDDEENTYM